MTGTGPVLHAVAYTTDVRDETVFVRVTDPEDRTAAALLATAAGRPGGTGSTRLGGPALAEAIRLLEPPEARRALRELSDWSWEPGDSPLVVLDTDPAAPTTDPRVRALRDLVRSGRQHMPPDEALPLPAPGEVHPLRRLWDRRWPGTPPISYHLKTNRDRWVRFHSLPASKRYAGNAPEYATVLHRHNTVLGELLGAPDRLLVITVEIGFTPAPPSAAGCWSVMSWPDLDPELAFGYAYAREQPWSPGALDPLLRETADDSGGLVIIAPPDLSWLYAPYDGGADVILPTRADRDELRERHRDWLSTHPAGL